MVLHDGSNEIPNGKLQNGSSNILEQAKSKTISLSSSLIIKTYSHTWRIRGFNEIPFISKYPIVSPSFVLGKESETSYQVEMTKHLFRTDKDSEDSEENSESEDYSDSDSVESGPLESGLQKDQTNTEEPERMKRLGLRLVKMDDDSTWDVIDYTFTLKTEDGFSIKTSTREEPGDWMFIQPSRFIYLTEKDFGDRNLFNEKYLDVVCDINYKYWKNHPLETPAIHEESQFAKDFKLLQWSEKFCDVLLETDGSQISAHKSVLCARASEFENLLHVEKTATKQTYDLKMDAEVGKVFVHFLYCGEIPDDFPVEKCIGLFKAADSYGVVNLKKICSEYFKKHFHSGTSKIDLGMGSAELDLEKLVELDSAKIKRIFSEANTT